ncbi:circadian clock protein LdpA [cyanobacterium endosymbiont of Epithemia clementina EcSB]|uniref:circadian clock protein LdpA n=1 Tax=cyanobacterium endosymbiont of Epithemia clementina EcSB TaxID=3034674 RepID=UPI0024805578|nr:LdpA C-terminal domain-containing domain [cyanobacterium endosymbiont of Epithemia clementina EcSB]WGT68395.1 LdpA C-terminal domain-containing domain [cyanobacterium endosymbiont of Epithemia clementina EcSB]
MSASYPLQSLKAGNWFKLICGASFQDLPAIRTLVLAYALAGADCVDVAADPAVITAAKEALIIAKKLENNQKNQGFSQKGTPWLMVSLNDGEDPHFRKAYFDSQHCPSDCFRPCETVCPPRAIIETKQGSFGVLESRCYGCGRCIPVCPYQLVKTRSYLVSPKEIVPFIQRMGVDAMEIHTQVGRENQFKQLWQVIAPWISYLKLLAISCPDGRGLIDYLHYLYDVISPLPIPLIWQTDGRPMSGDIGKGTTHAAIKLAQKVLKAQIPGFVQLAGGTNHHTVSKLREIGLLTPSMSSTLVVSGVAYGSYARSLLSPIVRHLETQSINSNFQLTLENQPYLLSKAIKTANSLVFPLKKNNY